LKSYLTYLLIQPNKLKFAWYKALISIVIGVFVFISMNMGNGLKLQADFTVFWQAGKNFSNNLGLYERIGGAERFIYPPFAAMLFQVFGLFSLQTAGAIWAFLNLMMWLMLVHVTRELFRFTKLSDNAINRAMIIAFVLSFRYFWYHLMFMQMNVLVLLLSMLGLLFFLRKNNTAAIASLVIATGVKVIPIVFLVWILSKMHPKIWFKAIVLAFPILVLPIIWRGWHLGIQDLNDYYVSFLEPFQQGRVEPKLQNYALSAALYKWFVPLSVSSPYFSPIVRMSADSVALIYKVLLVLSISSFFFLLAYSRFVIQKISVHEISFLLLFTHLISGITWEYHLVSLFVVYAVYFSTEKRAKNSIQKTMSFLLLACMIFNAIVGMDTVGKQAYYMSCGYSFLTLLMLILLIYSFGKILFSNKMDAYFIIE
jgi:hypothetical protein